MLKILLGFAARLAVAHPIDVVVFQNHSPSPEYAAFVDRGLDLVQRQNSRQRMAVEFRSFDHSRRYSRDRRGRLGEFDVDPELIQLQVLLSYKVPTLDQLIAVAQNPDREYAAEPYLLLLLSRGILQSDREWRHLISRWRHELKMGAGLTSVLDARSLERIGGGFMGFIHNLINQSRIFEKTDQLTRTYDRRTRTYVAEDLFEWRSDRLNCQKALQVCQDCS